MHVLIVYAHHDPGSFNKAMKDTAVTTLEECGHTVEVSDLYAMHFNPVADVTDNRGERSSTSNFKYLTEMEKASKEGTVAADIQAEVDKIKRANLVIFQFPLYWFSFPAIMKGWMDRVILSGNFTTGRNFLDRSKLNSKRAMLSFTTGGPPSFSSDKGLNGDMQIIVWAMQYGSLSFVGFEVLPAEIHYAVAHLPEEVRKAGLRKWADRLRNIECEDPLPVIKIENFTMDPHDPNFGMLTEDYLNSAEAQKNTAPAIGQHLGKPLPKHPMVVSNGTHVE